LFILCWVGVSLSTDLVVKIVQFGFARDVSVFFGGVGAILERTVSASVTDSFFDQPAFYVLCIKTPKNLRIEREHMRTLESCH
jgi:hypothetical protein